MHIFASWNNRHLLLLFEITDIHVTVQFVSFVQQREKYFMIAILYSKLELVGNEPISFTDFTFIYLFLFFAPTHLWQWSVPRCSIDISSFLKSGIFSHTFIIRFVRSKVDASCLNKSTDTHFSIRFFSFHLFIPSKNKTKYSLKY